MADPAAAVTDTHPLIYHAAGGRGLGTKAAAHFQACEEQTALLYVPAGVIWEVSVLTRAGRVRLHLPVRAFFEDLFSNPAYQPFDLDPGQIYDADGLHFNRDPFDGLIVAAARKMELPLLTRDVEIRASGAVRVMW